MDSRTYLTHAKADQILLREPIEKYLDQGYGKAFLTNARIAEIVQSDLLSLDGKRYRLSAWVVQSHPLSRDTI
jgi:hypothetical protein